MRLDSAVTELSHAQDGLMDDATSTRMLSTVEERNRITREIHDTIGYTLTNVSMMLEAAQDLAREEPPKLIETLRSAREQSRQGLDDIRQALHLLRDKEERRPVGLVAVQRMTQTFARATGIRVEVEYGNMPMSCGEECDGVIYHFIQEGLTNAFRHGQATAIRVALWIEKRHYRISVRDNGTGAENLSEGIGLLGMRERLGKLGGTLMVRNVIDGFEIIASVPRLEESK